MIIIIKSFAFSIPRGTVTLDGDRHLANGAENATATRRTGTKDAMRVASNNIGISHLLLLLLRRLMLLMAVLLVSGCPNTTSEAPAEHCGVWGRRPRRRYDAISMTTRGKPLQCCFRTPVVASTRFAGRHAKSPRTLVAAVAAATRQAVVIRVGVVEPLRLVRLLLLLLLIMMAKRGAASTSSKI
jgi:hypothetical protein